MSWIDRHVTEHPLPVIVNNNCDARKPFLVTDTDDFTDLEKQYADIKLLNAKYAKKISMHQYNIWMRFVF